MTLKGHCEINQTYKVAREHGMKEDELYLVYTPEQKKEICDKCKNIFC